MTYVLREEDIQDGVVRSDVRELIDKDFNHLVIHRMDIESIPSFDNIKILDIVDCYKLTKIPTMNSLVHLGIRGSGILSIPEFPNLESIICTDSPVKENSTGLPKIKNIVFLRTPDLTTVPEYQTLENLNISDTGLLSVPRLPNVSEIKIIASKCSEIKNIEEYKLL